MIEKISSKKVKNNPIGIFDSGFGGLTVMSAINKILPGENLIYFGDTAHVPYGSKSKDAVIKLSKEIAYFLIKNKVKTIVVACNTASAFALRFLQKNSNVPVIGVIEPGAKEAVLKSNNKAIGVIATEGTVLSGSYPSEIRKISKAKVYQQECPLLVPLVEEGWIKGEITNAVIKKYMKRLLEKKIDVLVLGCTHYPLIKKALAESIGQEIAIVDSAQATALEVKKNLAQKQILSNRKEGNFKFFVSDNPKKFEKIGKLFFEKRISNVKKQELWG
ncbi:MAG: glutamate racemase [Elusimicrobiota bacterium]|jgi:glutamate racemase|nr:glutamate racemase [Elusimicrobiota bacterium]